MSYGRIIVLVVLGVCPTEALAQTGWHLAHGRDDQTDNEYYVVQIKGIPVRIIEHEDWLKNRIKTRMTVMLSCNPDHPTTSLALSLDFDKAPQFSTNRRRVGPLDYYPVVIGFPKTGQQERRMYETEGSQQWTIPKATLLGLHSDMIAPFLLYDRMIISVMSKWDGDFVMAEVPLKGVTELAGKVLHYCGW